MRPAALVVLLLALPIAAPAASASCTILIREDLGEAVWAGNERVVTTVGNAWGLYHWRTGLHSAFATPGSSWEVAVSPDGFWAAWVESQGRTGWECAPVGPVLIARPVEGGEPEAVRAGDVQAIAAGPTMLAVVVPGVEEILLYRWGEFGQPTGLRVDKAAAYAAQGWAMDADPFSPRDVQRMRFSPDGSLLALVSWNHTTDHRDITVVDVATGIPVPGMIGGGFEQGVVDVAFDPHGRLLAILESGGDKFTQLRVHDLRTGDALGRWLDVAAATHVAWDHAGLAVALTSYALTGSYAANGSLVVFDDPTLTRGERLDLPRPPRGIAWTGDRELVVAMGGALEVYDEQLHPLGRSTPGAMFQSAPTPTSTPTGKDTPFPLPLAAIALALLLLRRRRG